MSSGQRRPGQDPAALALAAPPGAPDWQTRLRHAWQGRGLMARLLWPLSQLYGALVVVRALLFRRGLLASGRVGVPVLVVGNLVAGGAGKTPVILALAAHLQGLGLRVGVVSRGYGRNRADCLEVNQDQTPQTVGDEPALIYRRTGAPVFVAPRRLLAAQTLLRRYPDTQIILSDDGLQHLALQRDVEIGVFDERGLGNGWLLPAGPLREPWPRPLDLILTAPGCAVPSGFAVQRRLADHACTQDGRRIPLQALACSTHPTAAEAGALSIGPGGDAQAPSGQAQALLPLMAVAGIARPEQFFAMLRERGVTPERTLALPDHSDFHNIDPMIIKGYRLICTEKDAVKLWQVEPGALAVPLELSLPAAFWSALDARLAPLLMAGPTGAPKRLSSPHGHTTT